MADENSKIAYEKALEDKYDKAVGQFVAVLFHAGTNTHFMHLQTKSYAKHKALGKFYEGIVDLADRYAESYMGCYDVILKFPDNYHLSTNPLTYLRKLKEYVTVAAKTLPEESNLVNIHADILDLVDSTLYMIQTFE